MGSLEDQVLVSLRRIIRATDINSRRLGRDTGLTTPQLVVMRAIADGEAPAPSEIARAVSLSQATVTSILNRLEDHGLITRVRSEADRRRVEISLTPDARKLLKSAPQPLQESFVKRFTALEPWEQHLIVAALERVAGMMDAEELDAAPLLATGEAVR